MITKLLVKDWRKRWKQMKARKQVKGLLRKQGECFGGDEEVQGQRSAPLVISPVPERQSRPGQQRFRCQGDDWLTRPSGTSLQSILIGPFILPSLPLPVAPHHDPSFPSFRRYPLHSPYHSLPTEPKPVILSSFPLPSPPLTFFFTPLAKHYRRFSLSRPGWLGQLSVGLHLSSVHRHAFTHTYAVTAYTMFAQRFAQADVHVGNDTQF